MAMPTAWPFCSAAGAKTFLVDPGTYCYDASTGCAAIFSAAPRRTTPPAIDGLDQSTWGGGFLWLRDVAATLHAHSDGHDGDGDGGDGGDGETAWAEASHDGYLRLADPLRHVRSITLDRPRGELLVPRPLRVRAAAPLQPALAFRARVRAARRWRKLLAPRAAPAACTIAPTRRARPGRRAWARRAEAAPLGWVSPPLQSRWPAVPRWRSTSPVANAVITTRFTYSPSYGTAGL